MLEYLVLALLAALGSTLAWALARRQGAGQARLTALVEQLATQGAGAAAQAQSVAQLLEAQRAAQAQFQALQENVAAQRQEGEGLKAALAAAGQGLTEVKVAQDGARAALAEQVQQARQLLERVDAEAKERALRAEQAYTSLERLETVIAGTKSRGTAGENLLAEVIKQLPPEFRAYDVRINGKTVEFAIPLPDGKFLPVDSKWTSVDKLAKLAACKPEERKALVLELQRDVEKKVEEVAKYLDPDKTCMLAVLAVPDAVFDLCARAHVTAHERGIVIVPYSMAVPYVLSYLQVLKRFAARVDEAQLSHAVATALGCLDDASEELEGRLSRAIASLENSRRDLRGHVGKAQQALGQVRVEVPANGQVPLPVLASAD